MSSAFAIAEAEAKAALPQPPPPELGSVKSLGVNALANEDKQEALGFLSLRPIHTVFMVDLIRNNGLASPRNRGDFYGYRDRDGELRGVALIGLKTVIETDGESALEALGCHARGYAGSHLVRGEEKRVECLLHHYAQVGRVPRLVHQELLMEQLVPTNGIEAEPNLQRASSYDLESIVSINAVMACEENGVNPLVKDRQGITQRIARRIEQGRVWILANRGRLIFKADVISHTPEVAFVEGVYVHPEERRKGYGLRCMTQLGRNLLSRTRSVCLVVNAENCHAQALYEKAGYRVNSHYATSYF